MNARKSNVTFDDIAKYTNFSKTTISRYFNRPDSLTPENQERIRQALIDLDYRENKVAQILARGKSDFVGVIVPNFYLHYFSEMLQQILLTYPSFGYKFLIFAGEAKKESERRYLEELMGYNIEGLIVMSHTLSSEELARLPVPVVSIEREDEYISSVNCDNYAGAVQATRHLIRCGCDILIHINSPLAANVPASQRIRGFQDICRQEEIPHRLFIESMGSTHKSISHCLERLFRKIERDYPLQKKGIFFSDDTRANEFLNLIVRKYGKLPDSYRIIGFDNSPVSESAVYPISTMGQQIDVIAREAVGLLSELIEQKKASAQKADASSLPPVHRVISPVLISRATTE